MNPFLHGIWVFQYDVLIEPSPNIYVYVSWAFMPSIMQKSLRHIWHSTRGTLVYKCDGPGGIDQVDNEIIQCKVGDMFPQGGQNDPTLYKVGQ